MCRVSSTCLILHPGYASHKMEIMECCPRCRTLLAGFNCTTYPGSTIRSCSAGKSIGGHCLIRHPDHCHPPAFAHCSICLFLLLTFRLKPLHLWGFLRVIDHVWFHRELVFSGFTWEDAYSTLPARLNNPSIGGRICRQAWTV